MVKAETDQVADFVATGDMGGDFISAAFRRFVFLHKEHVRRFGESPQEKLNVDQLAKKLGIDLKDHPLTKYSEDYLGD